MNGETFSIGHSIIVIQYILFNALEGKLYTQKARMIFVCVIHGSVAPNFFSERLFSQLCDKRTHPATLEEVSDVTFKEKLLKVSPTIQRTLIRNISANYTCLSVPQCDLQLLYLVLAL